MVDIDKCLAFYKQTHSDDDHIQKLIREVLKRVRSSRHISNNRKKKIKPSPSYRANERRWSIIMFRLYFPFKITKERNETIRNKRIKNCTLHDVKSKYPEIAL